MKNPIPLLSVVLGFFILSGTFIQSKTCPCSIPTTSVSAIPETLPTVATTLLASNLALSKEVTLNFGFNTRETSNTQAIAEVLDFVKTHPTSTLTITGHTDDLGDETYNQVLSETRAATIMQQLVKDGINANQITTQGSGEKEPLVPNTTKEGRKQNRRVVIQIFS